MESLSARAFADALLQRYPAAVDFPYGLWSYPQGYLLMGFAKLWEATGHPAYFDYIAQYADSHVDEAGDILGFTGCSLDDIMAGAVLVWMYQQTGEAKYARACGHIRDAFRDYPRTREGGFLHNRTLYPGEMWVDGVFMGQMFLCRYALAMGHPEGCAETVRQLRLIDQYCHAHDGLLRHAYSEDCLASWAEADGRSGFVWSEGLGWYALILSEALALLPPDFPGIRELRAQEAALAQGLRMTQDAQSGLWYQVVDLGDRPDNWCDTSGSAMFLYALSRAVQAGRLETTAFAPVLKRGYQGLFGRLRPAADGGWDVTGACDGLPVQQDYAAYIDFPQQDNAKEAVCGVLWALVARDYPLA